MKIYSFFSVLLVSLLLFSCTQSNEEKAMALIETDMNQTLLHPSSFEVAKMSPLEKVPNHIFCLCNLLTINGMFS